MLSDRLRTGAAFALLMVASPVVPAAAQTAGERALLNRTDVRVAAATAQAPAVDGVRALLNRSGLVATTAHTTANGGPLSAKSPSIDGSHALLGRSESSAIGAGRSPRG